MWTQPRIGESVTVKSLVGTDDEGTVYAVYTPTHRCGVRLKSGCIVANWWQVARAERSAPLRRVRQPLWKRLATWLAK